MAGNVRGEGRSWVDQGEWYSHIGHIDHAVAAYKRALSCLPEEEVRHRFTAYQSLAVLHERQGEHLQARRFVSHAEDLRSKVDNGLSGKLIWTKAEIAASLKDFEQAEECYAQALEIYRSISPVDAALAAVELARVQLLQKKFDSALETTKSMASLLGSDD